MQVAKTNSDLERIQAQVVERRFDDALAALDQLPDAGSDDPEALYMRAVCHRYRREFEAALGVLAKLRRLVPDHGRAYQEEGHNWRDLGRDDRAGIAYDRATRCNPALAASWKEQLRIARKQGNKQQARIFAAQLEYLQSLPKPLVGVLDLIAQGKILKAEDLCRQFLQKVPHHVEAMRLLADIGMRFGVLEDAEFLLAAARKIEPGNVRVHIDYIQALRKRQKFADALEQARLLLATAPQNPQFQSLFAIESMQTGDYETALETFDQVLARLPGDPGTLTSKGHAYKTSGRYDEAVAAYRSALEGHPRHGEAWYALSNLKVYSFDDEEIRRMLALEEDEYLSHADRLHLGFALGKAYEDRGDFERSFHYYEQGNRLKKAQSAYDPERMAEDLAAQREVCTAGLFAGREGCGHPAPDPIFVVGLPRAGSTLLEQILSSHSQVDGTLELPNILSLSQQLRRRSRDGESPGYPQILQTLPGEELEAFGRQYIEDTRIHRQGAPFFIDKMPNNFRHIGLIQLILPNAKIIDARRHPMACGFSAWKQLFAEGQEFSYDLEWLGRYYRDYVELMDHWDDVLPGKVLRVQYETVVDDLEGQVRRILAHCGLEFEEGCVEYHRTERSVRTPSSEQVRQPIFTSGLDYWRNYDEWLAPLRDALGSDVRRRYAIETGRAGGES